nr:GtrA family protein [Parabacteroides sp. FAFU027]
MIYKFVKFCVVGFSGLFVDFGTTWLLKEKVHLNKYVANSTGFVLAATSNYFFNRFWTFHSQNSHIVTEYFSFFSISIAGLGINNLIIYLLTDKLRLNFYLSKLIAVGVVTVWNFVMNYLFTFR